MLNWFFFFFFFFFACLLNTGYTLSLCSLSNRKEASNQCVGSGTRALKTYTQGMVESLAKSDLWLTRSVLLRKCLIFCERHTKIRVIRRMSKKPSFSKPRQSRLVVIHCVSTTSSIDRLATWTHVIQGEKTKWPLMRYIQNSEMDST